MEPDPVSTPPEITRVGPESWISLHVYDEGGARQALVTLVPRVLQELLEDRSIDRFFFIRYRDERGQHVRLRVRLLEADADGCSRRIAATAGDGFPVVSSPYELEIERYGGEAALPLSLDFFTISSTHALAFERDFGGLPRSRQLPLTLCFQLWQAWGSSRDEEELRALLGYYALGQELYPEVVQLADETLRRSEGKLTSLVHRELRRLTEIPDAGDEPLASLASAGSLVAAARALSDALGGLAPRDRWSVVSSQMHMTANRLGLTNAQETIAARILSHAATEIAATDPELWSEVATGLRRPSGAGNGRAAGTARLEHQVRTHLTALLRPD